MHDVIVVGGGPVGSHVAYNLSVAGYDVAVLERKSSLGEPVCCTGIISRECFNSFNLSKSIIVRSLFSARLFAPGGRTLRVWRPEIQAYVINRQELDLLLSRRAQKAGAQYLFKCTVQRVEANRDSVELVTSLHGEKQVFLSRCVVDAAGFNTGQINRFRSSNVSDFTIGVQVEVETAGEDEVEVYLGHKHAPGFFAWLVPTFQSKALVGLMARRDATIHLRELLEELIKRGKIATIYGRPGIRHVPLKPLARTTRQRVITVGSAAGQVKPLTGGGIYYGLVCADIAARTLKGALAKGDLSDHNLSGYSREWHRRLGREIRTSYIARKVFERLTDQQMDNIFEIAEANDIVGSYLKMRDVSFDDHSAIVKKLLREKALSGIWQILKKPFLLNANN